MTHNPYAALPKVPEFQLTSDTFKEGERFSLPQISSLLGTGGQDKLPQLSWSGAPAETKSFALTCYDPDAPTGSGFWHLAAYNIPPTVQSLPEGAIEFDRVSEAFPAEAKLLRHDGGFAGFVGCAPPPGHGDHHYIFTVHALDVPELELDELASPGFLGFSMFGHTLARATLTGVFGH